MGLERNVSIDEMVNLGVNRNTAIRLLRLRQTKSVLKSQPINKYESKRYSKGGYALNKNGAPMDKSLLKSKPIW